MLKKFMEGAVLAIAGVAAVVAIIIGIGVGLDFLVGLLGLKAVGILAALVLVGLAGGVSAILPPPNGPGPR